MSDFGQCLRAFLAARNISQEEAATLLNWSQTNVSYYCRSKKPPRPHVLAHMLAKLQTTEEELLGGKAGVVYGGQAARAGAVVAEAGGGVGEWLEEVRRVWRRDAGARARIELAVRTLWGAARAEEVLRWLKEEGR